MGFYILQVLQIQLVWDITPSQLEKSLIRVFENEDGDTIILRNVCKYLAVDTA